MVAKQAFPRVLQDLPAIIASHEKDRVFTWKEGDSWRSLSSAEVVDKVRGLAAHLADPDECGLTRDDRAAFIIYNGPEWHIVRMACAAAGAVTVPILTEASDTDLEVILGTAQPKVVVAKDDAQADRARNAIDKLKLDAAVLTYTVDDKLTSPESSVAERPRPSEDDVAMIFFTSGTTSDPKGVMHTHRSLLANSDSCQRLFSLSPTDTNLSFLPVSHVFQHTVDTLALIVGITTAYIERADQVAAALQEVEPTVMVAVPRVFEVMRNVLPRRIEANLKQKSVVLQKLVPAAMSMGVKNYSSSPLQRLQASITNPILRPIRRKVRDEVFGSRMRFLISGGASLPVHVASYVQGALEVPLYQGWGMTEMAGAGSCNPPWNNVLGSCGAALPGVSFKLGPLPSELAEDLPEGSGEVMVQGPMVTKGYLDDPEATAVLIQDGWMRTGDVGRLDPDGTMWVVDRIKGFIALESGLKIMPQALEDRVRSMCPLIEQVVVFGDARPHLVALIYPGEAILKHRVPEPHRDAQGQWADAVHRAVRNELRDAGLAAHERIRNFHLLDKPLAPQDNTLTPTMKPRRRVILEQYGDAIEKLHV